MNPVLHMLEGAAALYAFLKNDFTADWWFSEDIVMPWLKFLSFLTNHSIHTGHAAATGRDWPFERHLPPACGKYTQTYKIPMHMSSSLPSVHLLIGKAN